VGRAGGDFSAATFGGSLIYCGESCGTEELEILLKKEKATGSDRLLLFKISNHFVVRKPGPTAGF
jgi:hypothetical protein